MLSVEVPMLKGIYVSNGIKEFYGPSPVLVNKVLLKYSYVTCLPMALILSAIHHDKEPGNLNYLTLGSLQKFCQTLA